MSKAINGFSSGKTQSKITDKLPKFRLFNSRKNGVLIFGFQLCKKSNFQKCLTYLDG